MTDDCKFKNTGIPDALSWAGLLECVRDEVASLRQSSEYARSTPFKEKIDSLTFCVKELGKRLEHLGCVPNADEPSFVLLARDPQAPGLVETWAAERAQVDPSKPDKVEQARIVADAMRFWKTQNPGLGMPAEFYARLREQGQAQSDALPGDHAG